MDFTNFHERELSEAALDQITLGDLAIVVHACDCKGNWLGGRKVSQALAEGFSEASDFLEMLRSNWVDHEKEDCKFSAIFEECAGIGYLITHCEKENHLNEGESLVRLKLAVDDMMTKLIDRTTIHSLQFSLENSGGPKWQDIRETLKQSISQYQGIQWIAWGQPQVQSVEKEGNQNITEKVPASKVHPETAEKRAESVQMLQSILEEMQAVDLMFDGKETEVQWNPGPVHQVGHHRRAQSFCPSQFSNVRNSIEVAKERKMREKSSPPTKKDRLPFKVFPQLIRRTSL